MLGTVRQFQSLKCFFLGVSTSCAARSGAFQCHSGSSCTRSKSSVTKTCSLRFPCQSLPGGRWHAALAIYTESQRFFEPDIIMAGASDTLKCHTWLPGNNYGRSGTRASAHPDPDPEQSIQRILTPYHLLEPARVSHRSRPSGSSVRSRPSGSDSIGTYTYTRGTWYVTHVCVILVI